VRPLPRRGDYDHQPIVGAYEVRLGDSFRHASYFGLSFKATLCYGTFRDDQGNIYALLRKLGVETASPLSLQTTLDGGQLCTHPAAQSAFRGGWGVHEKVADGAHTYTADVGPESFRFEHLIDGGAWVEGQSAKLTGLLIGGCGVQWYDPSPPGGYYTSEQYRAAGTILGREVQGFFCFDQLYLRPGMTWFESPYFSSAPFLEIAWHTFGTQYEDGSIEAGHVFHGARRMGFALIVDQDGPSVLSRTVDADIERKDNGYPERIGYRIDGMRWEWVGDPHGEMPDFSAGYPDDTYRPSEGVFMREGERRRPTAWWSFIDTWTGKSAKW
jgi:hypothetical protein